MKSVFQSIWAGYVQPMLRRPERVQLAALCYRKADKGSQVLLITSRGTGRWIIPKGWPMKGKSSSQTAMQEAWEEAGVRKGHTGHHAVGSYSYTKDMDNGMCTPVKTVVYPIEVTELSSRFPESDERTRKWVSPDEAANLVAEPELKELLCRFGQAGN